MDKIEKSLLKMKIERFYQEAKESTFAIFFLMLIVGVLSWNIYRSSDRINETNTVYGTLVGLHQNQSHLGSAVSMLSIKLDTGKTIIVTKPYNTPISVGKRVEVTAGLSEQGLTYYYFQKYIEE